MRLIINGTNIDPRWIRDEVDRMRPEYERVFQNLTPEEREAQLVDWAKENVVERILLRQYAMQDPRPIESRLIREAVQRLRSQGSKGIRQDRLQEELWGQRAEEELRWDRLLDELLEGVDPPSDEDIRIWYEERREDLSTPERVRAAHIVKHVDNTSTEELARAAIQEARQALDQGAHFETLADASSDCPGQGGSLGWFPRGQMVQEFEDVVFNMQPGSVSEPFQTQFGFHIVKLYEKDAPRIPPLEEVQEKIRSQLLEERRERQLEDLADRLKEKASILFLPQKETQPLQSLLVKPAGPDCNMGCSYCFYLEKSALFQDNLVHRMSETILEEMIKQAMSQAGPHITFGWQGGEPTLMGLPFFEKAVALQKKYGRDQTVGNGLQTNGLLLDKTWASFLRENDFLVGLSLDGPQHVHDPYRRDKAGHGTWEKVQNVAHLLLEQGVATNALCVVNDHSVRFPEEIYTYFKSLGFTFLQFIPCVEPNPNKPGHAAPFSAGAEAYGRFLVEAFDLWRGDFRNGKPTISVRFFDSVFHTYVNLPPPECTLTERCGVYVVVEHNGEVYACDFFVEPQWKLGNVMDDYLLGMLNSPRQEAFGEMKCQLPDDCLQCPWKDICRGGCTKDRLQGPGGRQLNHFCRSYQMFFEHAHPYFQELAKEWTAQQAREAQRNQVLEEAKRSGVAVERNAPCPCGSGKKFKKCCMKGE